MAVGKGIGETQEGILHGSREKRLRGLAKLTDLWRRGLRIPEIPRTRRSPPLSRLAVLAPRLGLTRSQVGDYIGVETLLVGGA